MRGPGTAHTGDMVPTFGRAIPALRIFSVETVFTERSPA